MMNNFLKQLQVLNKLAFRKVKRLEYMIRGYIYDAKIELLKARFNPEKRDDVNCKVVPFLNFEDYPDIASLNRYLRENFAGRYPRYIESKQPGYILVLKLVAITDEHIDITGHISLNNGLGKMYLYQEFVLEQ